MVSMICLFIHRYRWGYQIRGDERGFFEKARVYRSKGVDLFALEKYPSFQQGIGGYAYDSINIGECRLPIRSPIDLAVILLKTMFRIGTLRPKRPMAIYAYNQDPENIITGFLLKLFYRVPLVIVYHQISTSSFTPFLQGVADRRRRGNSLASSIWRSVVPSLNRFSAIRADVHLALSEATRSEMEKDLGVRNGVTVGNGVDFHKFRSLDVEKIYDAAFLGRLAHQKGIDILLRAWHYVILHLSDAKLVLIGGADLAELQRYKGLINELGLTKEVDLKGFVADEDVVRLLNSSKLFVFPSRKEGFAQAVSQAMSCGLCCILSDIPSLR
jgi:glycosyltransferase involved in cell wall biosynthesis